MQFCGFGGGSAVAYPPQFERGIIGGAQGFDVVRRFPLDFASFAGDEVRRKRLFSVLLLFPVLVFNRGQRRPESWRQRWGGEAFSSVGANGACTFGCGGAVADCCSSLDAAAVAQFVIPIGIPKMSGAGNSVCTTTRSRRCRCRCRTSNHNMIPDEPVSQ